MYADVPDLIAQIHLKLSAQLGARVRDLEASMYCTLFPPKEGEIVKYVQSAGRINSDMVENQPSVERGSPHILVLQRDAEGHREDPEDQEWGTKFPGPWKGRGEEDVQDGTDDGNIIDLITWIKARILLPTFAKPGQTPRSRIIFAECSPASGERSRWGPEGFPVRAAGGGADIAGRTQQEEGEDSRPHLLQMEDAVREVGLSFAMLETLSTADGALHKRRFGLRTWSGTPWFVCGAEALPGRAPRGNLAREAEQGDRLEKKARARAEKERSNCLKRWT